MKIAILNDTHCGIRNSSEVFLDNKIQIPIPENINHVEWKKKDNFTFAGVCSATESTNGFDAVKKGLIALKYLKVELPSKILNWLSSRINTNELTKIIENKSNKPFLILFFSILIF